MPINCPIPFNAIANCTECRHCWDDNCNQNILSPMPLNNILTDKEYIDYNIDKNIVMGGEGYKGGYIRGDFVRRGEFAYLQNKLNELYDKKKSRSKDRF